MSAHEDIISDDFDLPILRSLGQAAMRSGFNSDKLQNAPRIIKHLKRSTEIMLRVLVDARNNHDINPLTRFPSSRLTFTDQRTTLELMIEFPVLLERCEEIWMQKRACSESKRALSEAKQALMESERALTESKRARTESKRVVLESERILSEYLSGSGIDQPQIGMESLQQYQTALESYGAAVDSHGAASYSYGAASESYRAIDKQVVSTSTVYPETLRRDLVLQEICEGIRAAFEALQADFEQLPSVRLTPPPIFLRVVGPISTDLRPFHREKILERSHVYSLGTVFLENLMCDTGTSWDLRSYLALVATKLIRRGRPYPPAFTSELSLLVKRLVEANPQLDTQRRLTLKAPAESTGLEVSTTMTSRVGNDALIRRGAEGALMQRSLSAMINLSVRNLTSRLTQIGERPEFYGGFADIWRAHLASSNGKVTVAVKYLRLCVTQATKRLYQEIRIWQRLKHPHVLPLLGICHTVTSESIRANIEHPDPMSSIGIVCPWMVNGTLVDFLKLHQTEQKSMEELRLRLLIQVCSGLMYLHSKNIVHGDLHGGNVLVDSDRCARLADFGLSAVVADCRGTSRTNPGGISSPHGGALRWAAPELVVIQEGADLRLLPSADIYSVGGLILQAYTGDVPYSYYNERRVLGAIITGEKPRRPTSEEANISDTLWSVIEECWRDDPLERPTAAALGSRLQAIYSGLQI